MTRVLGGMQGSLNLSVNFTDLNISGMYWLSASGSAGQVGKPVSSWLDVWNADALLKLLPAVLCTCAIIFVMHRIRHPLGLPSLLVIIPVLFHIVLLCSGISLDQAQDAGWVAQVISHGLY